MKKFLVMLMVVAMASFLFVGCLGDGVIPDVDDEEEDEPVVPTTVAPIIIAQDAGALVNKAEAANGIIVNGTGRTYAEIKLSIDGVLVSSGDVAVNGTWIVVIAKADLGADGAKVLTATATEPGLAESAKSNEVKFTLDTVYPKIKSVKARAGVAAVPGTATVTDGSGGINVGVALLTVVPAAVPASVLLAAGDVEDGTCTLIAHGIGDMSITDPDGVVVYYTVAAADAFSANAPIPGVSFTIPGTLAAGQYSQIECVASTTLITDRATLKFDEDVSTTAALAGTYVITDLDTAGVIQPATFIFKEGNNTLYWNTFTGVSLVLYDRVAFTANGVADLAGNTLTTAVSDTCVVGAASATGALVP